MFGPLAILLTAFMLIFVPQVRRATVSIGAQWHRMLMTSAFMSLLGLGMAAVLLNIPESVGKLVLGDVWQPAMSVVPYMAISCVAITWLVAAHSMLAAHGMSAPLLGLHIIQVVLIVIFTAVGAVGFHSAAAIAAGEAAAGWVSAVLCLIVATRVVRRLSSADRAPAEVMEQDATLTKVLP